LLFCTKRFFRSFRTEKTGTHVRFRRKIREKTASKRQNIQAGRKKTFGPVRAQKGYGNHCVSPTTALTYLEQMNISVHSTAGLANRQLAALRELLGAAGKMPALHRNTVRHLSPYRLLAMSPIETRRRL
jgi:hypothetical protein